MSRKPRDIDAIFADGTEIDRALDKAERRAILKHKRARRPMPMWIDGKVEWVDPNLLTVKAVSKARRSK